MFNLILIWISGVSFLILFITLALRVVALRSGQEFEVASSNFYHSAQLFFDHLAFNLVHAIKQLIGRLLYLAITWSQIALTWIRRHIVHVERKVTRVVDVVNGKGEVGDANTVSLFLKEIDIRK
ncbi:MAG: hypothetical protein A2607_01565 [Candidatus Vogelbacteria bacterium RIFOXYD1_FULL_42_15]|uniref:Uncharacterized protein n=1 Tax=Candidatus Vogelbacteria bacterium RIFOXYD1_FULL_42_15 TaxID=1802437 RepID=A0A1G2QIN3_9BACT|nr:MAG: hypothetical protein A2607_01565 [Candidatus Vogelbacteria bacterium RIFOXYD1_FULL_42_15]